mmetsp:Transcript_18709/g.45004  ORF Transcript_18709/g.45004 Transcript_18709/m.45004 type:complete len:234 (+) Transcript_18709:664-1365(+)
MRRIVLSVGRHCQYGGGDVRRDIEVRGGHVFEGGRGERGRGRYRWGIVISCADGGGSGHVRRVGPRCHRPHGRPRHQDGNILARDRQRPTGELQRAGHLPLRAGEQPPLASHYPLPRHGRCINSRRGKGGPGYRRARRLLPPVLPTESHAALDRTRPIPTVRAPGHDRLLQTMEPPHLLSAAFRGVHKTSRRGVGTRQGGGMARRRLHGRKGGRRKDSRGAGLRDPTVRGTLR